MELNFCRRCGTPLQHIKQSVYTCQNDHTIYLNPVPSSGIFILTPSNEVILSVRGQEPHKGMLDAFGGFVDGEETIEHAAERELKEELQLEPADYEPLRFLNSSIGHYELGGDSIPVLSCFFWTRLTTDKSLQPSDDVAATKTIPLKEVNLAELHDDDIREGIKALQQLAELGTLNT